MNLISSICHMEEKMGGKRDEELACMLKVFYQERGGTNSRNGWGYIEKKSR